MSSSHARVSSNNERRSANENGTSRPRPPSGQQGSRSERPDPRRTQSPQPQPLSYTSANAHKRTASGSQRNKVVEERRTERSKITTTDTLISRTKSPERRSAPSAQSQDRPRQPKEHSRAHSVDPRAAPSKQEVPQGMLSYLY